MHKKSSSTSSFVFGETVRVVEKGAASFRGELVSDPGEDKEGDSVEILRPKESTNKGARLVKTSKYDSVVVPILFLRKLLPFENESGMTMLGKDLSVSEKCILLKEQGNALFKIRDFEAAEEYYMRALDIIDTYSRKHLTRGNFVYLRSPTNKLQRAEILGKKRRSCSVVFLSVDESDVREGDSKETKTTQISSILSIVPFIVSLRAAKRALHSNIAKCCVRKRNDERAAAFWHANIAVALSQERPASTDNVVKALCLRINVAIENGFASQAKRDCVLAASYSRGHSDEPARSLPSPSGRSSSSSSSIKIKDVQEIASSTSVDKKVRNSAKSVVRFLKCRKRGDRVLAKEFSKWIELTMRTSENRGGADDDRRYGHEHHPAPFPGK